MNTVDSRCPSPTDPNRYGLWSVWDMLELKAGAFYQTATRLTSTASWIDAKSAENRNEITDAPFHEQTKLDPIDRKFVGQRLDEISEHLSTLNARVTLLAVQDAKDALEHSHATWGDARSRFVEISNTLKRELSLQTLLVLEPKEQAYFSPNAPHFGVDTTSKFQTAAFEVDEAAKCLALGRSTASAFHLMRVLEIGIRAIARSLQIPDPTKPAEKNWAIILKGVLAGIETKWPTAALRMTGDGQIFEALYASLDAVKNPWRNATMHVESKYTNEEAEHIFAAVRGFMKKLASRMNENGLPLA